MALHVSAHHAVTGQVVLDTFRATIDEYGCPASTLTDNGMVYTVRHSSTGVRGGKNAFERALADLGITQKNGRGNHPQTQGKVERFQQTMKKWLRAQPEQPATVQALHTLIDDFHDEYNNRRPRRSLPHRATPVTAYTARPKAAPGAPTGTHERVAPTRSANLASSPCDTTGACTTSESADPTPEPTSCSWSKTSRSASSTPPPANSCAS